MTLRLLCVTPMYPEPAAPSFGGFVEGLNRALSASGDVEVDLLTRRPGWRGAASYGELLARGMARHPGRYDLIWGHYLGAGAAVAVALAKAGGRPVVLTAHGSDVEAAHATLPRVMVRALVRRCDGLHLVSEALATRARELIGALPAKTLVQPIGVDLDRFTPRTGERLPGRRRLLMVGSFAPAKGWRVAIEALARLAELDLELIAIGSGDPSWVRDLANATGSSDRLFLRAERANAQMPILYQDADLVIAPSWREGFGLVPLEAMACGVPVVCSGVGGMADYIRDGVNARITPANDAKGLALAVREVLGDSALRGVLTKGGLSTASGLEVEDSAGVLLRFLGRVTA